MANMNRTKVITGINTKLSYFHGWEPVSINGGAEKYSVSVLIQSVIFCGQFNTCPSVPLPTPAFALV